MANVTFKQGEVIKLDNGQWEVLVVNDNVYTFLHVGYGDTLTIRSDAGEGTNYSIPVECTKESRTYKAMRYLHKWVATTQQLSNVLFQRYQDAQMVEATKEPLYTKEDIEDNIGEHDITNKWVIIKPTIMKELFFEEGRTRRNQVVLATGGFGCKAGSLSPQGGKVYVIYADDSRTEDWVYRNELLGIASEHVIEELNLPQKCPDCTRLKKLDTLSRDNKRMICSECGTMEALREMGIS